jgi:hypothetical protein
MTKGDVFDELYILDGLKEMVREAAKKGVLDCVLKIIAINSVGGISNRNGGGYLKYLQSEQFSSDYFFQLRLSQLAENVSEPLEDFGINERSFMEARKRYRSWKNHVESKGVEISLSKNEDILLYLIKKYFGQVYVNVSENGCNVYRDADGEHWKIAFDSWFSNYPMLVLGDPMEFKSVKGYPVRLIKNITPISLDWVRENRPELYSECFEGKPVYDSETDRVVDTKYIRVMGHMVVFLEKQVVNREVAAQKLSEQLVLWLSGYYLRDAPIWLLEFLQFNLDQAAILEKLQPARIAGRLRVKYPYILDNPKLSIWIRNRIIGKNGLKEINLGELKFPDIQAEADEMIREENERKAQLDRQCVKR